MQDVQAPEFTVTIEKAGKKLAFECEVGGAPKLESSEGEQYTSSYYFERVAEGGDSFEIIEMYMYEGSTPGDSNYAVSGHVIDTNLYEQLKQYLGERGIDEHLVQHIKTHGAQHEHQQYMKLLADMRTFTQ